VLRRSETTERNEAYEPFSAPCSSSWMRLVIHRRQLIEIEMGVSLRSRQTGVTEHFLNNSEIGPAVQEMGREGMAQTVRTDLHCNPRLAQPLLDYSADAPRRQASAAAIQKYRGVAFARAIPRCALFHRVRF
jgi:hypothetical protein